MKAGPTINQGKNRSPPAPRFKKGHKTRFRADIFDIPDPYWLGGVLTIEGLSGVKIPDPAPPYFRLVAAIAGLSDLPVLVEPGFQPF
jgi:hypothetical protein